MPHILWPGSTRLKQTNGGRDRGITMEGYLLALLVVAAHIVAASCLPTTVPAFLWSNDPHRSLSHYEQGSVNYNVISPRDLAKDVLNMAGWSQLLCSGEKRDPAADVALVFIGNKLRSPDISRKRETDSELIELLKASFTDSSFSMAFPYVTLSGDSEPLADSLLSGFMENCDHGFRNNEIAFVEPCFVEGANITKVENLEAISDYVNARKEIRMRGTTDLIFICNDKSSVFEASGKTQVEGKMLADIIKNLQQDGIIYTVLYTSEPYEMVPLGGFHKLERFLISNDSGNGSANSTYCDAVCKSKASILEGFLVDQTIFYSIHDNPLSSDVLRMSCLTCWIYWFKNNFFCKHPKIMLLKM